MVFTMPCPRIYWEVTRNTLSWTKLWKGSSEHSFRLGRGPWALSLACPAQLLGRILLTLFTLHP